MFKRVLVTLGIGGVFAAGLLYGLARSNDYYWEMYQEQQEPEAPIRHPGPKDFVTWDMVLLKDGRRLNQPGGSVTGWPATTFARCENELRWQSEHWGHVGTPVSVSPYAGIPYLTADGSAVQAIVLASWCAPLGDGRPWWQGEPPRYYVRTPAGEWVGVR